MDKLINLYEESVKEFNQSSFNFQNATGEYVDVAILNLKAAELKMSLLLEEIKKTPCMAPVEKSLRNYIQKHYTTVKEWL